MADSNEDRQYRAIVYGCINLNAAFVQKSRPIRIFRKRALRLTIPEMIWIVLATFAFAGLLALVVVTLGDVPVIGDMVSWLLLILAPVAGWPTGRRIARTSPYRAVSGEGLGEYLWTQSDRVWPELLAILRVRPIARSEIVARASGRAVQTPCIEWIGSARASIMPVYNPELRNTSQDVILLPSTEPTDWADRVQRGRNKKEFVR